MKRSTIVAIPLLLLSGAIMAKDELKSTVEAGFLTTTGNTETRSMSAKATVEQSTGKFRNKLKIAALYVKNSDDKQAERYFGEASTDYRFNPKMYGFLNAKADKDLFSGYEYQTVLSVGVGYLFIDNEKMTLDADLGPGYRFEKEDIDGADSDGEVVGRVNGKFVYNFSEKSNFTEELTSDIGSNSIITNSITSLTAQIAGELAMKISYIIKHNTNAPDGIDKTDTITALTLLYTFDR